LEEVNTPAPVGRSAFGERLSRWRRIIVFAALGVAIMFGAYLMWRGQGHISTDDAFVDGRISVLGARVAGSVLQVLVTDNQEVEEGDVLVRLDPRDYVAQLEQARASVTIARGQYEAATMGVPLINASVRAEEQQVLSELEGAATGELSRALAEHGRMKQLVGRRIVSAEEFDKAEAALRQARSKVAGMQASLRQTRGRRREVDVQRAQMRTAEGRLAEALARQLEAEQKLEYTTIRAPFAGRVTKKAVEVGQIVNVAQPLLSLVSTTDVWVVANFKESQLAKVRPGQAVTLAVDMYPGLRLRGRVESVQAGTGARFALLPRDNTSGNFVKVVQRIPVKVVLDSDRPDELPLFPGMSVVPTIDLQSPLLPVRASRPAPPNVFSERHGTSR
jgi:membrane fusion protein (multidrug efflux system)